MKCKPIELYQCYFLILVFLFHTYTRTHVHALLHNYKCLLFLSKSLVWNPVGYMRLVEAARAKLCSLLPAAVFLLQVECKVISQCVLLLACSIFICSAVYANTYLCIVLWSIHRWSSPIDNWWIEAVLCGLKKALLKLIVNSEAFKRLSPVLVGTFHTSEK